MKELHLKLFLSSLVCLFLASCSTPVSMGDTKNTDKSKLSKLHANYDEVLIISIDGNKAPDSSVLGDQDYWVTPGTHQVKLALNWTGLYNSKHGHAVQKTLCVKTTSGQAYTIGAILKPKSFDWEPKVTEWSTRSSAKCN